MYPTAPEVSELWQVHQLSKEINFFNTIQILTKIYTIYHF